MGGRIIISCAGHWPAEEKKDPTPKQCRATPFITRAVTATAQLRKRSKKKRKREEQKKTDRSEKNRTARKKGRRPRK